MLKRTRIDSSATGRKSPPPESHTNGKGKARIATVEDEVDEEVDRDFAPGGDADYFTEEDEDGRFFGGGLTSEQKEILNIFESAGGEAVMDDVSL